MTVLQRQAWYNLAVVLASLVVVVGLTPVMGRAAQGGFGLLGLLGLSPFFLLRKDKVVVDERDEAINRRSVIVGYTVFWLVFVAFCTALPVIYGWNGSVPVGVVSSSVFVALIVVVGVTALANLVQYGRGGVDAD
jgi:hypothetical protein